MSYSNIKRVLSAALLLAFASPATLALTTADTQSSGYTSSAMTLNGNVNLVNSNQEITLSLRDSDVKQVLRMFADKAGLNIVFHSSVAGNVTLDLVNTPINDAFNLVLNVAGLNYYRQGNTMIVMASNSPDNAMYSKQEMLVFPVKYVSASKIAEFLNKNVFSMKKAGMSGVDAATVNSATNELIVFGMPSDAAIVKKVIEQFDREPISKTFAVNHTTPAEMANMICKLLLPSRGISGSGGDGGSGGSGGDFGGSFGSEGGGEATGGAAGIMTGAAADAGDGGGGEGGGSVLKLGEGIVACSSTAASNGSLLPFNVQNLSVAYFPQRGTVTLMGGSEAQAQMVEQFIKANDVKQPQAMLEVSIIQLDEIGSKEFQNQWKFTTGSWSFGFDGTSTNAQRMATQHGGSFMQWTDYVWNGKNGSKEPYEKDGEWTIPEQQTRTYWEPFSRTPALSWQMNYLIQNRKGRVLANPKILITNGQESVIDLTQDYVEKVTSEFLTTAVAGGGSSAGTVQRTYSIGNNLGIKVSLTPFISPEGYVTLNIKPDFSTVYDRVNAQGATGQMELVATLLSRRNLDLKNIRIKDNETLIIGGMIQESEQKQVNKIPFLGDLPLVGSVFRSTSTEKTKNELVIMITPKIINDGEGAVADNI